LSLIKEIISTTWKVIGGFLNISFMRDIIRFPKSNLCDSQTWFQCIIGRWIKIKGNDLSGLSYIRK